MCGALHSVEKLQDCKVQRVAVLYLWL